MEKYFLRKVSVLAPVLLTALYLDVIEAQKQDSFQQRYIGCYYNPSSQKNNWTAVILNSNVMTIETCVNSCRQNITTYAILQDGRNCLCGDDLDVSFSDITCNVSCSGNGSQVCGGTRATMIAYVVYAVCPVGYYGTGCDQACHCKQQIPCYRASGVCPNGCESNWTLANCSMESNVSARYIGCYSDYPENRQMLPFLRDYPTLNTIEYCSNACATHNITYAGMQYSYQCFCGESYGSQQRSCNSPCAGNSNQICGDAYANSVYSVCPRGSYGKDCIARCNCANDKICRYDNGNCGSTCKRGWSGDSCSVRSCSDDNGACSENESCVSLKFSALPRCQCSPGYQRKRLWDKCTDVDECISSPCGASMICSNTEGSFDCKCTSGFTLVNSACKAIDECEKNICDRTTTNCTATNEGFVCSCLIGLARLNTTHCKDASTCMICEQQAYSLGVVVGASVGSAVGSAVIAVILVNLFQFCRHRQQQRSIPKNKDANRIQHQEATDAPSSERSIPSAIYETLEKERKPVDSNYTILDSLSDQSKEKKGKDD